MNKKKHLLGAAVLLVVLIALDQLTKKLAVIYLYEQDPIEILPGVFELHFLMNRGAAFGILQNHPYFFAVITCFVLCVLVYAYLKIPFVKRHTLLRLLLVLLMAGAVGNLVDRIRQGYVVDFFYFKLIDFPIFNVADCYVVVSVILLALLVLFYYKEEEVDQLIEDVWPSRREKA